MEQRDQNPAVFAPPASVVADLQQIPPDVAARSIENASKFGVQPSAAVEQDAEFQKIGRAHV